MATYDQVREDSNSSMDEAKEEEEFLILLLKLILDFNNVKLLEKMMKIDGYKLSIIIEEDILKM